MRVLIPLRSLMVHALEILKKSINIPTEFKATVYEDNMGAYYLANNQRLTPRSKFFSIKFHHFWEAVNSQEISVERIETTEQNADYLTKGLPRETFIGNRNRVQGWITSLDQPVKNKTDRIFDENVSKTSGSSLNGNALERESRDTSPTVSGNNNILDHKHSENIPNDDYSCDPPK